MRIRLDLSYDGTDFSGWASQPGLRTVQGTVEAACDRILRLQAPARLTVAGRTDAGVHARGQVAHLDITAQAWERLPGRSDRPPHEAMVRRLNAVLPGDIAILSAGVAPDGFDARFSAVFRRYSYRITHSRDPFNRRFALLHEMVDAPALDAAAQVLIGERDFAAFCKARPGASTIRTLHSFTWRPWVVDDLEVGSVAELRADAFCHNMVRSLVGATLAVGTGRRTVEWLRRVAAMGERSSEVHVAAPHPLVLEEVGYPPADQLAARAAVTRGVRTLPNRA